VKIIKQPAADGKEWWIIVHDLKVKEWGCLNIRPINIFTNICHLAFSTINTAGKCFNLSIALENKLYAVWHYQFELE
jgi:hypothetical protein